MRYIAISLFFYLFSLPSISLASGLVDSDIPRITGITAREYVLMDANSNVIVDSKNATKRYPPASLTKVMTSYIISKHIAQGIIGKDDKVKISRKSWKKGGSKMFVNIGSYVEVKQLLRGLIIQSGNDAAIALAEYISGNEKSFVILMNRVAKELGMKETHFMNATGWPEMGHYSTPYDMALLTSKLVKEFPEDYKIYSQKEFTYNKIRQFNRNLLLWENDGVDGVKTGHTEEAKYNLIASAKKKDFRLISVTFGSKTIKLRARDGLRLLRYGFRYFSSKKVYKKDQVLFNAKVWKGKRDNIELKIENPVYITYSKQQTGKITTDIDIPDYIFAPIFKGDNIGVVKVRLDGKVIKEEKLVAAFSVESSGFLSSLWQSLVLFFVRLFD
jgi:D-alanyl-D-alanine carboxypeptidase (penicillin-binding protein 5/6)